MSVKKSVNALDFFGASCGAFLKNGKLVPAYRAEHCGAWPQGITFAAYSRLQSQYIFATESALFESDGNNYRQVCDKGAASPFMVEDYRNGTEETVIIAGNTAATYWNNTFLAIDLGFSLSCGAVHCGRLFGGDGLVLRWSGTNNIADKSEGLHGCGQLKLDPARGNILDLKVFGGKLVAVREYGLTVLSMYGSPENFSVDITDTDCDKIFRNTACVVGDKLYFYSSSGLKYFDGVKICAQQIKHSVTEAKCCAEYAGRYFVAGKNGILCVDISDGDSCLLSESADSMFVKDGVYICNERGLHRLEDGGKFFFKSGAIDFGTGRLKTVTKIDVRGKADIKIISGGFTRIFTGASGAIHPHLRGRSFYIEAEGEGALDGVEIEAEVTDAI